MEYKSLDDYPDILTAKDISDYLHISRRRVYELFNLNPSKGGIPNLSIGASRRVKKDSLIAWINKNENS